MLDRSLVILSVPCVFEGCECILEQIIFDDNEILPAVAVAGKPIELEFLPFSLLLRATGAKWVLPRSQLPRLSSTVDLRGLFQLKPTSTYIRREVGPKEFTHFKRTVGSRISSAYSVCYCSRIWFVSLRKFTCSMKFWWSVFVFSFRF